MLCRVAGFSFFKKVEKPAACARDESARNEHSIRAEAHQRARACSLLIKFACAPGANNALQGRSVLFLGGDSRQGECVPNAAASPEAVGRSLQPDLFSLPKRRL